jgi:formylglycine-generating enzyme required for sulfatase activity
MKHTIFLLALLIFTSISNSQIIENVSSGVAQDNKSIIISYDILEAKSGQQLEITLWMSSDSGEYRQIHAKKLQGDAGLFTIAEDGDQYGKRITYLPSKDESKIRNSLIFDVRANIKDNDARSAEYVLVKGGTFMMGSTEGEIDETPVHAKTVGDFYIGKYEVTQAKYEALRGVNPAVKYGVGDNYPVYYVSWWDAVKYCNALSKSESLPVAYDETTGFLLDANGKSTNDIAEVKGYRLSTEAEWEYAAGGGQNSTMPRNDNGNVVLQKWSGAENDRTLSEHAWYSMNAAGRKRPVGTKKPNALGIFDMSGSVWEWCHDWHKGYEGNANVSDNSGGYRIYRGGSCYFPSQNCRVAYRSNGQPTIKDYDLGFRVVLTKTDQKIVD